MKQLLLTLILSPFLMFGQDFVPDWIGNIGGTGIDQFKEFKKDANGGVFVVGEFQDTLFLDDGVSQYTLVSQGGFDGFVIRFSGDGKIVWANILSSTDNLMVNDIDLDANGNIYIVGDFKGTVFFDFAAVAAPLVVSSQNGYLASYDTLGNYNWAVKLGNVSSDGQAISVVCDRQSVPNKIHVAGHFLDSINCDPTYNSTPLISSGGNSVYKAEFDDIGNFVSSFSYGQSGQAFLSDMEIYSSGDLLMSGQFIGSCTIDPQNTAALVTSISGSTDTYVMLIDPSDNLLWRNLYGGVGLDQITDVEFDNAGDILIGGYFSDSVIFNHSSGFYEQTIGGTDAFLLKCNAGGGFEWFSSGGGVGDDRLMDISISTATNTISCIGSFVSSFQLINSGTTYTLSAAGGRDLFLSFYDPNNQLLRLQRLGSLSNEEAGAILRTSTGVMVGCVYVDSMDVNSSSQVDMIFSVKGQDAVVMALLNCNTTFDTINPIACDLYISPNGDTLTASAIFNDTLQNVGGCDSVITIFLQLGNTTIDTIPTIVCKDFTSVTGNVYSTAGIYNDTVPSFLGCDSIIVTDLIIRDSSGIASVLGDTLVCNGANVSLAAIGSAVNTFSFYGADSITLIASSGSLFISNLESDTLVVMRSFDGLCESFFTYEVKLFPTSSSPNIDGDEDYCKGDTMRLSTNLAYSSYQWTYPDGSILLDTFLQVGNIQPSDSGLYVLQGFDNNGCLTELDSIDIVINEINFPNVISNSPICFGDPLTISTLSTFDSIVWTSPTGDTFIVDTISLDETSSSYINGAWQIECHDTSTGCFVTANPSPISITVVNKSYFVFPNDTICQGETVSIQAFVDATASVEWMSSDSTQVLGTGSVFTILNLTVDTIVVLKVIDQGCVSYEAISISLYPLPVPPVISGASQVCQGDSIFLFDGGFFSYAGYQWTSPSNLLSNTSSIQINSANNAVDEGYYTLQITDFNGCQSIPDSLFVTVIKLNKPVLSSNSPICNGDSIIFNSSTACDILNLQGPGASTPYFSTTFTIDSLDPNYNSGLFQVECVDTASGCTILSNPTFVLIRPKLDPPVVSYPNQVCFGSSVTLNSSTLIGASYNWYVDSLLTIPASISGSSPILSNITSDTILYLQIERFGCTSPIEQITISVLPIPQAISLAGNNSVCEGDLLNIYSTVSAASYLWTWPSGQTSQDSSLIIPNATLANSGVFILQGVDQNGCSMGQVSVTVAVNPKPTVPQVIGVAQACAGNAIECYLTGSYDSIRWEGPQGAVVLNDTLLIPPGTPSYQSGSWTVRVIDLSSNCSSDTSFSISVLANPTPMVSGNGPICEGDSLVFQATALSSIDFQWSSSINLTDTLSTSTDLVLLNLTSDTTVYLQVLYPNGCKSSIVSASGIVNTNPLQPTILADTARCVGNTVNLTTPSLNQLYNWSTPTGANYNSQTVSFISSSVLDSGVYTLTVIDSNGCSSPAATWLINVYDRPDFPILNDVRICEGDTLVLSVLNHSADQIYEWFPPASTIFSASDSLIITQNSVNYSSGIWYVYAQNTVTGCVSETAQTLVSIDSIPVVSNPSGVTPICFGGSTTLSVATKSNETYYWYRDSSLTQFVSTLNPFSPTNILSDTIFYLQVENIAGCLSIVRPFPIQVNPAPNISIDVEIEACEGDSLIFRSITTTDNYLWSGPNGFLNTAQVTYIFPVSSSNAGLYSLVASDSSGCLFTDTSFTVQVNNVPPKPTILTDSFYCNGDSIILVSNASCDQIVWSNGNNLNFLLDSLIIVPGSPLYNSDQWIVTCIDTNTLCSSASPRFEVTLIDSLAISILNNGPICAGDIFEAEAISLNGNTFIWYDADTSSVLDSSSLLVVSPVNTTSYVVKVQLGSCLSYASVIAQVDTNSSTILALNDTLATSAVSGVLFNVIANDSVQSLFTVNILQSINQGDVFNLNNGFMNFDLNGVQDDQVLIYEICSPVCNAGCDTATVFIDVQSILECDIPNIFTPNGDNVNDVFFIPCLTGLGHQILIFNRWGDIVYESDNYQSNWDGRHRGVNVPDGTYFYILRTRDAEEFQGSVEIRR